MTQVWKEREDLEKADRKIAEIEKNMSDQMLRITRMARNGQDATEAEKLFQSYQKSLRTWRERRLLILEEIARQDEPEL